MATFYRKFLTALALIAGIALIGFELRRARGLTGDNVFWIFVGGLIIVLCAINLVQKRPPPDDAGPAD